MMLMCVEIL